MISFEVKLAGDLGHPKWKRSNLTHLELHHTQVVEETRYDREILEDIRTFMQEEETIEVTWAFWCCFGVPV